MGRTDKDRWWKEPWYWAQILGYLAFGVAVARAYWPGTVKELWDVLSGATAAAWVQTVGSIAAIVFALKAAREQSDRQHTTTMAALKEQHRRDRFATGKAAVVLLSRAEGVFRTVRKEVSNVATLRKGRFNLQMGGMGELRDLMTELDRIEVHMLPSVIVGEYLQCVGFIRRAVRLATDIQNHATVVDDTILAAFVGGFSAFDDSVRDHTARMLKLASKWGVDDERYEAD